MLEYHVILPAIFAEPIDARVEAFNHALVAMRNANLWGRTFVLSDGIRRLIVAEPGKPLRTPMTRGSSWSP